MVDIKEIMNPDPLPASGNNHPPEGITIDITPSADVANVINSLNKSLIRNTTPKPRTAIKKSATAVKKNKTQNKIKKPVKPQKKIAKKSSKTRKVRRTKKIVKPVGSQAVKRQRWDNIPATLANLFIFVIVFGIVGMVAVRFSSVGTKKISVMVDQVEITGEENVGESDKSAEPAVVEPGSDATETATVAENSSAKSGNDEQETMPEDAATDTAKTDDSVKSEGASEPSNEVARTEDDKNDNVEKVEEEAVKEDATTGEEKTEVAEKDTAEEKVIEEPAPVKKTEDTKISKPVAKKAAKKNKVAKKTKPINKAIAKVEDLSTPYNAGGPLDLDSPSNRILYRSTNVVLVKREVSPNKNSATKPLQAGSDTAISEPGNSGERTKTSPVDSEY